MATLKNLTVGQVLHTITKHKMGNTTMNTISVHQATIVEVHENYVIATWNGNTPRRYSEREVSKWRTKKPIVISSGFSKRLATKAEIAAMNAE